MPKFVKKEDKKHRFLYKSKRFVCTYQVGRIPSHFVEGQQEGKKRSRLDVCNQKFGSMLEL